MVDAIAWVLGAQAPSAVRSQKMDDVIFAGTDKRPALGRAEVSLTIDNSAGLLAIEFTEVTLTRTLFRTGESEYAINGVPCRLLDIQELLSDSGVGRQQHVIVSQGQIDAVLNARAEDRRAIIEEAAGVLKFRKRKEKAERRLEATEGNLLRLQDLLREVRRQLRPLERQAEAARRHGDLVAELDGLRLFLAGREITALQARLTSLAANQTATATPSASCGPRWPASTPRCWRPKRGSRRMGGTDLADAVGRVDQLRERARGLAAVVSERRRATERDVGRLLDTSMVATLEADAARLRAELTEVGDSRAALEPVQREVEADEAVLAADREAVGDHDHGAPSSTAECGGRGARRAASPAGHRRPVRGRGGSAGPAPGRPRRSPRAAHGRGGAPAGRVRGGRGRRGAPRRRAGRGRAAARRAPTRR